MGDTSKVIVTSILNDIRRKFDSTEFEGGAITSILGSADLDLRDASMTGSEARLEITNVLGNTYVYPAENWDVQLEIVEIAGRCKDRRKDKSSKKAGKNTLLISGVTIFGDVYIR
jgi:predicted membrane protein